MSDSPILKPAPHPDTLLSVARECGTPTYVYFEDTIRKNVEALRSAFAPWDARVLYAMKANSSPAVLRVMREQNLGIDAVSPAEAALAQMIGFQANDLFFSANNMSEADIEWAARQRLLINVGEESSLPHIARCAPGTSISLRVNLEVGAGHHAHVITGGRGSKFGIVSDALPGALEKASQLGLRVEGLHQHIGSGNLEVAPMIRSVERLVDVAMALPSLRFVNIGGGLGIPYGPYDVPMDLPALVTGLTPNLDRLTNKGIAVWIEPGRYLVAEAGVLVVAVNAVKDRGEIVFAGTDSGMGHLIRPSLYQAHHGIWNLTNPSGQIRTYDVVGNICETGDFFGSNRAVQEIRNGDVLAILDAGAYGMSMASEYNLRPLPAEVIVGTDGRIRVARRRETSNEVARRHFGLYEDSLEAAGNA